MGKHKDSVGNLVGKGPQTKRKLPTKKGHCAFRSIAVSVEKGHYQNKNSSVVSSCSNLSHDTLDSNRLSTHEMQEMWALLL